MRDTPSSVNTVDCDLLVIGSGAGGLSTAVTARKHGLDVLVVEKDSVFGGTTAFSGGVLWIPGNPVSRRANQKDTREAARLPCGRNGIRLRCRRRRCVPGQRTEDGRLVRARDQREVRADAVS